MIKTRPQKTKTTSQLIKELDDVFSEFIRLRDCNHQGTVKCFVTGEKVWWRDSDAAHFHPRQHMGTRWDERNVHATTRDTNRYQADHLDMYERVMYVHYSLEILNELHWAAKSAMKFTAFELQEKITHYSEEVKKLRALKKI
jgi:Bacteriophage Lambda NinG protein